MKRPDIAELLRGHDAELQKVPLSLSAEMRVRRRLRESTTVAARPTRFLLIGLVAGASALLVGSWLGLGAREPGAKQALAPSVSRGDCVLDDQADGVELRGHCTFRYQSVRVSTDSLANLRRGARGLELIRGEAWFDVEHVPLGQPPVRVQVGGGTIEVLGTRFFVNQDAGRGSVLLSAGRIRFVAEGSAPVELLPGARHDWVNRPRAAAEIAPPASASLPIEPAPIEPASRPPSKERRAAVPGASSARPEAPSVEEALSRAVRLRSQGRYRDALEQLAHVQSAALDARTAEALSFETGSLLERTGDRARACSQYTAHLRRFPAGDTHAFAERRQRELCSDSTQPTGNSGGGGG